MAQAPSYGARGLQRTGRLPEAASQTFKIGDFVTLDSNGNLCQALATDTNYSASSSGTTAFRPIGRATQNGSNLSAAGAGMCSFIFCEPGTQFLLPVYHGTPASAVPNTNQIGKAYEVRYRAGVSGGPNFFSVDVSANTNPKVKIVDMLSDDHTGWNQVGYPTAASTKQYGQVWCEFIDEQSGLVGATLV